MKYTTKTIDELCEKITDGAHNSPEECIDGPYPMYSSKDMLYGGFSDSDVKRISDQDYKKLVAQDCQPQKNDILIIKDGANYLKYAFKIPERLDAVILSSIAILRPNTRIIDPDYFTYLLRTDSIRRAMSNFVSGAAIPRIVLKDFKRMKLRFVTDINSQREIAKILISYDNLIDVNNKRIRVLEQMAENLYKEWFVRFLFPGYKSAKFENGIPKEWTIRKLGSISLIKAGGDRPEVFSDYPVEGINVPIFSNGLDNEGLYGYTDKAVITEKSVTISARGTVGFVCLRRVPYVPIVRLIAIVPNENIITPLYLYYCLQKDSIIANGTSQQQITVPMVSRKRILTPPIALLERFNKMEQPIWDVMDKLREQNNNLIKQRDLLLPRLMSGKLEV